MQRQFGMMPPEKVKLRKVIKNDLGLNIQIQAGPEGWTIIYPDGKVKFGDNIGTSSDNYRIALSVLGMPELANTKKPSDEDEEEFEDVDYGDEDADFESTNLATEDDDVDYGDEDS